MEKMRKRMSNKKVRMIMAICIVIALIIAISIGVISNSTKDTSADVGKQHETSQELEEDDENEEPDDELEDPNEITEEELPEQYLPATEANPVEVVQKNNTGKETYYIKVNNQANVVTVYKKDANGNYTVPVKAMLCSIGTATPTGGVYKTTNKYTWRLLVGNVYGQYATRITGSILFHSVPYTSQNKSTLEWWEYDKLGTKASAGCVRLTVADAKWIYDNCSSGTQVEFYYDSNPGPLGKPSARKISDDVAVRNWDPTDPDANNPWRTYTGNNVQQQPQTPNVDNNGGNSTPTPDIPKNDEQSASSGGNTESGGQIQPEQPNPNPGGNEEPGTDEGEDQGTTPSPDE